jgi:hypothetical protein
MATTMAVLVFGGALSASVWAIAATVRPELDRIVDLLKHGPVATPSLPTLAPARSSMRDVRVRSVRQVSRMRAAA